MISSKILFSRVDIVLHCALQSLYFTIVTLVNQETKMISESCLRKSGIKTLNLCNLQHTTELVWLGTMK